jgi:heat shock protein HtpX
MGKRVFLFLVTNLAIVLTLSVVVSVLGVAGGPDLGSLAVFCLVWGMGGAFISLQMSRWIAKRATGVHLIDGRTGDPQLDWLYHGSPVRRICRCLRWASTTPGK